MLCCLGLRDFGLAVGRADWRLVFTAYDVGRWPFSVGALVKLASFLSGLHLPTQVSDSGNGESLMLSSLFCTRGGRV